jgi:hypothetical protein
MTPLEVIEILKEAEKLAHKIANRKSVLFSEGRLGEFFNSNNRDRQTIWKDVVIAYNHFKAIDLDYLVRLYNEPKPKPNVMRSTREITGRNGCAIIFSDECPIKGACHISNDGPFCTYYQGVSTDEGDFSIACSYKEGGIK